MGLFRSAASTAILSIACICLTSILVSRNNISTISVKQLCDAPTEIVRYFRAGNSMGSSEDREFNVSMFKVDPMYQAEHERIDTENLKKKCRRYGLTPYEGPPRRLFFGTMVADENWEVFRMNAIEVYGVYHVAVFIEANTTHMATPRKLRFKDSEERDLLVASGMFGPNTKIYLDYWLEDWPELQWMDRESEQRNTIIKVWKEAGMQPEDVAVMADVDEVFSRDFLRAVQTCDFPELRPGQSCQRSKICPAALSFESSPYCIKKREWFHPDIIGGQCVEGIGDPTERVVPLRNFKRRYGERHKSYGRFNLDIYPEEVHKSGRYPLFNGPDIRTVHGDRGMPYTFINNPGHGDTAAYGVAFHFHNWFTDLTHLRNKYLTYAHGDRNIMMKTLSEAGEDLDIFVRCTRGINNEANPYDWSRPYYEQGWNIKGPRPIFFLNSTYTEERHKLVQKMLVEDEAKYGSSYDSDGVWVENTLLTRLEREAADKARATLKKKRTVPDKEATRKKSEKKFKSSVVRYPNTPYRDSSTATIMGMATGLHMADLTIFVGSLRKTGYQGHIILGVNDDIEESVLDYFKMRNVTPIIVSYSHCTFEPFYKTKEELKAETSSSLVRDLTVCAEAYPDVKLRWAKYPMGIDWLEKCKTCTGPVMITDVRDVYFQYDPFGPGTPEVTGLQVFEEHPGVTTEHWLVDWPVGDCKGVHFKKPMLCSGTTVGTPEAMIKYLATMYKEMRRWIKDPKCRFKTMADDQSIHNWLFYNGDLEGAVAVKFREGIVNTVGFEGDKIFRENEKRHQDEGDRHPDVQPFPGATLRTWISTDYGITNEDGEFTNLDGTVSPVIHQYDRLGPPFQRWLQHMDFSRDDGTNLNIPDMKGRPVAEHTTGS